jgi:hypothetical protein
VESPGAQTVYDNIALDPGLDKTVDVLLPTTMVTYKWSVTPTTITDKYDLTLDMTYRTDVPAPAIVISPLLLSLAMEGGQTYYTQYTVTNKGLISVFDFELEPINTEAAKIELPFTTIAEIKPGQTIVVPVKVTLVHASCNPIEIAHKCTTHCAAGSLIKIMVESLRILAGNSCPTGGGIPAGGSPSVGWERFSYGSASARSIAAIKANAPTGCGGSGGSWPSGSGPWDGGPGKPPGSGCSKDSDCGSSDVCKKGTCNNGICGLVDNSAEANSKVDSGEVDIMACKNRKPSGIAPIINGCGTERFRPNPTPVQCAPQINFTEDCNEHDRLYGACNSDAGYKDFADRRLNALMKVRCNSIADNDACYKQCLITVDLWYEALKLTGYLPPSFGGYTIPISSKGAFGEAQKDACYCCGL